jgi:uncharacterized membrane protein YfcA
MRIPDVLLLVGAGLSAGAVNAVAGGGSLITFPALLATGLPPIVANVSNSLAVSPGYLASVAGSRRDIEGQEKRAAKLIPVAVIGALAGSGLLLVTPARAFELIVPFLVLTATALLAFQPWIQRRIGHPHERSPRSRDVTMQALTGVGAIYGGYFGGALGVILVAVLALVLDERLQRISALKNVLSAAVGVTTVVVFALLGPVSWLSVAVLAPATVTGGYTGAQLVRRMPARILRGVIVTFGTAIGIVLLVRALV